MPIKAMVYKTLSTVVDDFFAFAIKMPLLHRLACFRGMLCSRRQRTETDVQRCRRRGILCFPVPTMDLPCRPNSCKRVWAGIGVGREGRARGDEENQVDSLIRGLDGMYSCIISDNGWVEERVSGSLTAWGRGGRYRNGRSWPTPTALPLSEEPASFSLASLPRTSFP